MTPSQPTLTIAPGRSRERSTVDSMEALLIRTSRTFGITIPYLPEPWRREVTLAYLLLRIADTLEDASLWKIEERSRSLQELVQLLAKPDLAQAASLAERWLNPPPCSNPHYLELLGSFPQVMAAILDLEPAASSIIFQHAQRVAAGMAQSLAAPPHDLTTLRQYCYYVAGIVGELITDLFLLRLNTSPDQAAHLRKLSVDFGEGLQLVNILKDAAADAQEGRCFLPASLNREEVFTLARNDLQAAAEYTALLQEVHAPTGLVLFTTIPIAFAQATLDRIQQMGPGAKLTRSEVNDIRRQVESMLQ